MILLVPLSLAEPADAPFLVVLDLPPTGVVRVSLPPDIAGLDPRSLDQTLRLLGPSGEELPFTTAITEPTPRVEERLDVVPVGFGAWRVGPSERAVDHLRLRFSHRGPYAVHVDDAPDPAWLVEAEIDGETVNVDEVATGIGHGPWMLRARNPDDENLVVYSAHGVADAVEWVPPHCVDLPAGDAALREGGTARYALDLGGPRHVSSLELLSSIDLFDRELTVAVRGEGDQGHGESGRVRRVRVGGARIDRTVIRELDLSGDALVVDVATEDGRVLAVDGFRVCSVAAHLVARDVGPGPFHLYAGGEAHEPSGDLAAARVELLREAGPWTDASATPVVANAAYQAKADREGVSAAAAPLPLAKWRWSRPIAGEGWVRVMLDRSVLAHARADLGDLRVVDADGRQVPMLLRRTGRETTWDTAPFTREEADSVSRLKVSLGTETAPVATVRLATTGDTFRRTVRVLRDRGAITEPLRVVEWRGDRQGENLAIAIDAVLGRELLVEVENGDNPPLAVSSVSVSYPEWELRARVPAGARLLYGAPSQDRPSYDLGLLSGDVFRQRLAVATLGAEEEVGGPVLRGVERVVMLAAVGVLALALLGLTARVLLAGRPPDPG